jgi:hypothetical protein
VERDGGRDWVSGKFGPSGLTKYDPLPGFLSPIMPVNCITEIQILHRTDMKKPKIVLFSLLLSSTATASDHLLPEESLFTGIYYENAFSLLSSRLDRMHGVNAFANAVVLPSFDQEYVVVFENSDDDYSIVCMQTERSMAAFQRLDELKAGTLRYSTPKETDDAIAQLKARLPENYLDVEAKIIEIEIDQELGRRLYTAWGKMLYETRYPAPDVLTRGSSASFAPGLDGTTYHFSFFHGGTPLSGWVWDYPSNGRVEKFIAITTAAKAACESKDPSAISVLSEKVQDLAAALKED